MKKTSEQLITLYLGVYLIILLSTEALSAFHLLTATCISLVWLGILIITVFYLLKKNRKFFSSLSGFKKHVRIIIAAFNPRCFFRRILRLDPTALIYLSLMFIFAVTLLTALIYPPNNWDSMTYHMGRIPHWIQNRHIEYYTTSIERQNFSAPLAEFAILQLQLLAHSDYLANITQWAAFVICILASGLIIRELGGTRKSSLLAMIITACIPMAILQSSSTQNDLVLGSFIMIFSYYMLKAYRRHTLSILPTSLALGMALATKGNGYMYAGIIGAFYGIAIIVRAYRERGDFAATLQKLLLIVLIGLVLNTGIYIRNIKQYHKPLYAGGGILCTEIAPEILYGNIIRNSLMQLNLIIPRSALTSLSQVMLGELSNNPAGTRKFVLPSQSFHEDTISNFFHYIFGLILCVILFISNRKIRLYLIAILAITICYCLLIKWQLWGSRLQLSIFLLISPVIALGISRIPNRFIRLIPLVLIIILGILTSIRNSSRPPFNVSRLQQGRSIQYFSGKKNLYPVYTKIAGIIGKEKKVGLIFTSADWYEYPLWVLTGSHTGQKTASRFDYITGKTGYDTDDYDYILTDKKPEEIRLSTRFKLACSDPAISLYKAIK